MKKEWNARERKMKVEGKKYNQPLSYQMSNNSLCYLFGLTPWDMNTCFLDMNICMKGVCLNMLIFSWLKAHSNLAVGKVYVEVRTIEIHLCFLECINNFWDSKSDTWNQIKDVIQNAFFIFANRQGKRR